MSSEPGVQVRVCPHCDASIRGKSERCWLCNSELDSPKSVASDSHTPPERRVTQQFSLSSLMLMITLLAVVLGVTRLAPGVGIVLAIVTAPALIRTCVVVTLKKTRGTRMEMADKMALFLTSFGGVVVVAVAASVAFYVTCWGGFLGGSAVSSMWATGYEPLGWGFLTGIVLGGIAGLFVVYSLLRRLWFPRAKTTWKAKGPADERSQDE